MSTPQNRPMRPGTPPQATVVAPGGADVMARKVLAETESAAPSFIPSIPNDPVATPALTPTPVMEPPKSEDKSANAATASATPKVEELPPLERWKRAIDTAKISETEANQILNSVIQKGYWEREYQLWGGKVTCTFRTRDAHHLLRVRRDVEALDDRSDYSVSQTVFRANVSSSLVRYQTMSLPVADLAKALQTEIEDTYQKRYEFVGKLPAPVYEQLTVALAHFDGIVAAACSEGAAQGF